jgi:hypothetical protein
VTVTVSGRLPCVQAVHPQHAEQLAPSMNPTGYIPAANNTMPHSTSEGGSTD